MKESLEEILAGRVRLLMAQRSVGALEITRRVRLSETSVRRILSGEGSATLRSVQLLAKALQVPALDLLRGEPRA